MEIMIIYHQAFDLYHAVYRMIMLLTYFDRNEYVELDRLRIWDFYLLFPDKMHEIKLKKNEDIVRDTIKTFIRKKANPYEVVSDSRKLFEKIKPYQLTALKSLASYGIIDTESLALNRITIISKEILEKYQSGFEQMTEREGNVIKLMTSHFYLMSMFGEDGLKSRTQLLECKYDA